MPFNPVLVLALLVCAPIGAWGVLAPTDMAESVLGFTTYFMVGASWWWLLLCTGFVVLAAALALGPYGSIRLGKDDEEPEFSFGSWIAMLFAGGMGAGLLFWGVAEPVIHFESPPGEPGGTAAAARQAMVITNLHWGLHAWSIYGVCALVIAYFTFRLGKPPLISTPLRSLFSGRSADTASTAADVLGIVAVVFGLAGSLAMGTLQVRSGLNTLLDVPATQTVSLLLLAGLFAAYMLSTLTGVDKGMRILSNINMILAIALIAFVLLGGPTAFILETFVNTVGAYAAGFVALAFRLYPFEGLSEWSASWTLTYLIWWLAWGPFVGVFIARISRGRTIREFCAGVILLPTVFSIFWFAVFGGAGHLYRALRGGRPRSAHRAGRRGGAFRLPRLFSLQRASQRDGAVSDRHLPRDLCRQWNIRPVDDGDERSLNPAASAKLVWGTIVAILTAATLLAGSVDVARAMATLGAIPFSAVLILQVVSFLRILGSDPALRRGRAGPPQRSDGDGTQASAVSVKEAAR